MNIPRKHVLLTALVAKHGIAILFSSSNKHETTKALDSNRTFITYMIRSKIYIIYVGMLVTCSIVNGVIALSPDIAVTLAAFILFIDGAFILAIFLLGAN